LPGDPYEWPAHLHGVSAEDVAAILRAHDQPGDDDPAKAR
jgi:hypothetical protein